MIITYKHFTPQIDGTCFIAPGSTIVGNVEIGSNSSVWYNAVLRGDIEKIVIGSYSNIQDGCVVHCVHNQETRVGSHVTVGHGAILHSCSIGDNSLIGMGAIVLDGVRIGKNCLVGAGAVVTPNTDIPDGSMVLGSPAKVKRQLAQEEIDHIKANALEYVRLSKDYKDNG